jgi:predicted enzyme related to lactoylglutathione lyase
VGIHHMGFVVDDLDESHAEIEKHGGKFHMAPTTAMAAETKYRDPDGVVFDIATAEHAWAGIS